MKKKKIVNGDKVFRDHNDKTILKERKDSTIMMPYRAIAVISPYMSLDERIDLDQRKEFGWTTW